MLGVVFSTACVCAIHAQEAFDAEKTRALFAGTEWVLASGGPHDFSVTFTKDGQVVFSSSRDWWGWKKTFQGTWKPSGTRSITFSNNTTCELSPDRTRIYATDPENKRFTVVHRGPKMPPFDRAALAAILCKPGLIWAAEVEGHRRTMSFEGDINHAVAQSKEGETVPCRLYYNGYYIEVFRSDRDGYSAVYSLSDGNGLSLMEDGNGGWMLKSPRFELRLEPIQPGDPLAPQQISRARSSFGGTTWCFFDGKGKMNTVTFMANGTVSDFRAPNEKPEWVPYDDGTVRYRIKNGSQKLTPDTDNKRLLRESNSVREIWFSGRQPPRLNMVETKQLKDKLADKSKAWFNYDDGKKTVYVFDDKSSNMSIIMDNGTTKTLRWEILCAGYIRIGDEAFMVEGDTLERVEPRLTLKHEPNL